MKETEKRDRRIYKYLLEKGVFDDKDELTNKKVIKYIGYIGTLNDLYDEEMDYLLSLNFNGRLINDKDKDELFTPEEMFYKLKLASENLYKELIDEGMAKDEAEIIKKTAMEYIKSLSRSYYELYESLSRTSGVKVRKNLIRFCGLLSLHE